MTFGDLIKRSFSSYQHAEMLFVLSDLGIHRQIESAVDDFYRAAATGNRYGILSQFSLTTTEFVRAVYPVIMEMEPGFRKLRAEMKIADLATCLVQETGCLCGLEQQQYIELLTETVKNTYLKHNWDFTVLEKLLKPGAISFFTGHTQNNDQTTARNGKPVTLDWRGDKQLDLFVDDLTRTFQPVRCKKHVYSLFDKMKTDFKIELHSRHLPAFLTLFSELHESGVIKVTGNRGLFVYLHQHLQAPKEDRYPKRDFRKLKHEAEQNERLKDHISRMIKPLLDKYGAAGR
ncbi:MAG: hypothetical protein JNM88_07575 [Chitinophagaceae bacterium]|nr:hypothetical protein [Chitinophagaceae bacterium]